MSGHAPSIALTRPYFNDSLSCVGTIIDSNPITLKAANIVDGHYMYTSDLLKLEECKDSNHPIVWPTCPSPICCSNWVEFWASHPDRAFASYILSGLTTGFRVGFDRCSTPLRSAHRNHPSSVANASVVEDHISLEVEAGRLVGPLKKSLAHLVHTSPIGLVPKSHETNKWRMIVDLSFPQAMIV